MSYLLSLLLTVTAFYSYEVDNGLNRICYYESIYGLHAITIRITQICPMTIEVEG